MLLLLLSECLLLLGAHFIGSNQCQPHAQSEWQSRGRRVATKWSSAQLGGWTARSIQSERFNGNAKMRITQTNHYSIPPQHLPPHPPLTYSSPFTKAANLSMPPNFSLSFFFLFFHFWIFVCNTFCNAIHKHGCNLCARPPVVQPHSHAKEHRQTTPPPPPQMPNHPRAKQQLLP